MFALVTVTLLITVVVIIAYIFLANPSTRDGKFVSKIPGLEATDPKNGNFSDIMAAGGLHDFLVKMHNEYGPIISFWYGQRYTVSVASPEILKDLKSVFDRPGELFQLFAPLISPVSIQFTNGLEGKLRRKTTDATWSHDLLRQFCEHFNKLGEETVAKLSSLPEHEHVPLCQNTLALTIKGLSQTSFGSYFKDDAKCHQLKQNYETCFHEMEMRLDGCIPEAGSLRHRTFEEALGKMHQMIKDIVQDREANPPKPHERAFIDEMIDHSELFTEPKLLADAMTYMVGGFHTSGYLLAWTLYFLTLNKDVEEKVYQEIMNVVGPKDSIGPDDISKFEYMKQVMNESLRLCKLAPWAAKVQDVDITLAGYDIPKHTPVITALGVLLQDEKVWPNPKKFDPDRFSPENVKSRHQYAFQPFGLPGRICPGYRFAYYELTVFLAILVRSFKWTLIEGQVVESVHGFVTSPKEEIWIKLESRK